MLDIRGEVLRFPHDMINVENGKTAASRELTGVHLDRTAGKSVAFEDNTQAPAQKLIG